MSLSKRSISDAIRRTGVLVTRVSMVTVLLAAREAKSSVFGRNRYEPDIGTDSMGQATV
jgi:hypothetical protein